MFGLAFQADSGYFLSCPGGGGSTTTASTRWAHTAEAFTETTSSSSKRAYKSSGGKYLTAVNGGGGELRCDATSVGSNEQFTLVPNKATSATVTVSSESVASDQLGIKAIDGVVEGYPSDPEHFAGDTSREWATAGETNGAWIQLKWSSAITVQQVTLYDRPNLVDNILKGTLLFSNGTSVPVGALPADGSGLTVKFSSRKVTWIRFRVDQAEGSNIGLAELQVWPN